MCVSVRLNVRTPTTPPFLLGFEQQAYVWIALAQLEKIKPFSKRFDRNLKKKIIVPIFFSSYKKCPSDTLVIPNAKNVLPTHLSFRITKCPNAFYSLRSVQIWSPSIPMDFLVQEEKNKTIWIEIEPQIKNFLDFYCSTISLLICL